MINQNKLIKASQVKIIIDYFSFKTTNFTIHIQLSQSKISNSFELNIIHI